MIRDPKLTLQYEQIIETPGNKQTPQKYEGAMPSFELGGGGMQQSKYDAAATSPTTSKFEPKYEPNLSMENSNSSSHVAEPRMEAPPRNILVAPENNSISMTLMQWESTDANSPQREPFLNSETLQRVLSKCNY